MLLEAEGASGVGAGGVVVHGLQGCNTHDLPGCTDETVTACVCQSNDGCCRKAWTAQCVALAAECDAVCE